MILDIHHAPELLSADICIIGSGAAGITLAREFIGHSAKVVVMEGGGLQFEEKSQEPYRSENIGLPHNGLHEGRARTLGGTTTLWAGQALPLLEMDFRARSWVPYSGWPMTRAELIPFYARAETVMQIPHASYNTETWPRAETPPSYAPDTIHPIFSQFAAVPNFATKYRAEIEAASNITLISHANVTLLTPNDDASALRQVTARSFDGRTLTVSATYFVVCCGGIETARLLLASRTVEPHGIGNAQDVVGRYFQDHPGVTVGIVRPKNKSYFASRLDSLRKNGVRYALKMAATDAFQEKNEILNCAGEIYYPIDEGDPIQAAKNILHAFRQPEKRAELPQLLGTVLRRPDKVVGAAFRFYVQKQPASVGSGEPYLGIGCEQCPNPKSRIRLSDERDSLGVPRTVLDWQVTALEGRSLELFLNVLCAEWKRLDIGDIDRDGFEIAGREQGLHGGYADASHHIGTTRMGINPRESVVDSHCRVHGYDNLYIGSSAVFPTGGFSNPTLTVIALCLRMADELKGRISAVPTLSHAEVSP